MTSILTGIGAAFAVGIAQAVVGPFVEWHIEQKRQRSQQRKKLIQDWREMLRDVWGNARLMNQRQSDEGPRIAVTDLDPRYRLLDYPIVEEMLKADERYYSLRNRMEESKREYIESEAGAASSNVTMPKGLSVVSEEIDRIESEWGLVDEDEPDSEGDLRWWEDLIPDGWDWSAFTGR